MKLQFAAASDRGLVREKNEDSAYAGPNLLALADGIGGHAAGEIASQLMISHVRGLDAHPGDNDMLALLGSVADDGNRAIAAGVREDPNREGMGTTLTALMFDGEKFGLCHVGDSRAYRLRGGKLEQITVDDTLVQSFVEQGKLDPEEVSTHPQRSVILKAYTGRAIEPSLKIVDAEVGDRLLLCSDGLSDPVTASTIESTLKTGDPVTAAKKLVELALRSGGPDNVTVVVADVCDGDDGGEKLGPTPVTAGALNADEPEDPRPDTAAGRAAVIRARQPQTIEPADTAAGDEVNDDASPPKKRGGVVVVGAVVLVALLAAAGGVWWAATSLSGRYFVAVDDGYITIEQGADYELFGKSLHKSYQATCLNREGRVTLIDNPSSVATLTPPQGCALFMVDDLPESVRGQIDGLPAGSYDEVLSQVQRLADDALPVCVTRRPADTSDGEETSSSGEPDGAGEDVSPTTDVAPGPEPGKDDLGTPGVNCRRVD